MNKIFFRHGTFGRWEKPVVQLSHSGEDWNKYIEIEELSYWIKTYNNWGYDVIFKSK